MLLGGSESLARRKGAGKMYIIAECGINWQGDIAVACELIRQARQNGANAVKFQLYSSMALWGDNSRTHLELSRNDWMFLVEYAKGIDIFASVFDEERLGWCVDMGITQYKVPWRVLRDDPDLTEKIFDAALEVFVSCPLSEAASYDIDRCHILQLTEGYPCFDPYAFSDSFSGISDHTLGIGYALHSIAHGAEIVEKHFTLQKQYSGVTGKANDHVVSMDAHELYLLSTIGSEIELARGVL
jgi:N,N'-diacetyllegionaminate synthase